MQWQRRNDDPHAWIANVMLLMFGFANPKEKSYLGIMDTALSREAHAIMLARVDFAIRKFKSDTDLAMKQTCCDRSSHIATLQLELETMESVGEVWKERRDAGQPTGATRTQQVGSPPLCGRLVLPVVVVRSCWRSVRWTCGIQRYVCI
jgi:hypothetical protein